MSTATLSEAIVNNTYSKPPSNFFPYHETRDKALLNSIVKSMKKDGWQGAPVVQYGGQLITGSHRYEAAKIAGVDLQAVDLCDVFCIDEDELQELINDCDNWVVEATYMAIDDNADLAKELGLDAH